MPYKFALSGGLGDCIRQCFERDGYSRLSTESKSECIIHSHNPFSEELVKWHPAVLEGRCKLTKKEFNPADHALLPMAEPRVNKTLPIFFGVDVEKVRYLLPKEPYVILAPDAGDPCKGLPDHVLLEALGSYPVEAKLVLLGSTKISTASNTWLGDDSRLKNVLDLRNVLNVPETILAIRGAKRVYTAHSAINIIAWLYDIPQTVCLPRQLHYELYMTDMYRTNKEDYGMNHTFSRMILY
jgi:hypothetical protein